MTSETKLTAPPAPAPAKKRKKLFIILGIIAAVVVVMIVVFTSGGAQRKTQVTAFWQANHAAYEKVKTDVSEHLSSTDVVSTAQTSGNITLEEIDQKIKTYSDLITKTDSALKDLADAQQKLNESGSTGVGDLKTNLDSYYKKAKEFLDFNLGAYKYEKAFYEAYRKIAELHVKDITYDSVATAKSGEKSAAEKANAAVKELEKVPYPTQLEKRRQADINYFNVTSKIYREVFEPKSGGSADVVNQALKDSSSEFNKQSGELIKVVNTESTAVATAIQPLVDEIGQREFKVDNAWKNFAKKYSLS